MYKIIALLCFFLRLYVIPNPLNSLSYGLVIWIFIEPLVGKITYKIVGLFYEKNSFPAIGAILYMVFYMIHLGMTYLSMRFGFGVVQNMALIIVYIIGLFKISSRIYSTRY